jgi:hypothetical protein
MGKSVTPQPMLPFEDPERWLPVVRYEGLYEVSDLGRVRSMDRAIPFKGTTRLYPGRLMRITNNRGYLSVRLSRESKGSVFGIHRLVMAAFVGPCPDGMIVCHGPRGALDNRLCNLSYGTRKKNSGPDRLRDGTLCWGEAHGGSVLTEERVRTLRERYSRGDDVLTMKRELGVSRTAIDSAVCGKTWRHLPGAVPLRGGSGEAVPWSKLTETQVREIRARHVAGERQDLMALEYGMSKSAINLIVKRRNWKHVA